ncbi:endonuclease-reverse transcriptase [Plakobranchus ocellatus]|uniref:Endonuclease-reverse transcriptase n=1 Tax=Plakobranchus ocellatus TaxID=259542 RepID=A0AAV4ARY9_9GAST|nr:endonuclease-reverse transcriptase [Plakobranchus ocellatus]
MVHSSLYGCKCLTLTKDTDKQLEAVEMWFIWRIKEKVSWTKRKTNAEVMGMAGYKTFLLNTIKERQLKVFSHIKQGWWTKETVNVCQNM